MFWRLHRNGKRSLMRFPPGTRIRDATKFGLQVLRLFIDMSLAFRSGLMATAMGSAASPIADDSGDFWRSNRRRNFALGPPLNGRFPTHRG